MWKADLCWLIQIPRKAMMACGLVVSLEYKYNMEHLTDTAFMKPTPPLPHTHMRTHTHAHNTHTHTHVRACVRAPMFPVCWTFMTKPVYFLYTSRSVPNGLFGVFINGAMHLKLPKRQVWRYQNLRSLHDMDTYIVCSAWLLQAMWLKWNLQMLKNTFYNNCSSLLPPPPPPPYVRL